MQLLLSGMEGRNWKEQRQVLQPVFGKSRRVISASCQWCLGIHKQHLANKNAELLILGEDPNLNDQLNTGTSHRLLQQAGEKLSAAEAQTSILEPVREMSNFFDLCVPGIDVLVSSEQSKWAYQPINIRK